MAAGEEAVAEAGAVAGVAVDDSFAAADADSLPGDSSLSCFADPAGGSLLACAESSTEEEGWAGGECLADEGDLD